MQPTLETGSSGAQKWSEEDARRKISALLSKAKSTASPAEAVAFANKAADLARKYSIDPASLDPDKVTEHFKGVGRRHVPTWKSWLAEAGARLNSCATLLCGGEVIFIGRKGDSITAELMFEFFVSAANKATRDFLSTQPSAHQRRRRANAFRNSFANELLRRCEEAALPEPGIQTAIEAYMGSVSLAKWRSRTVQGHHLGRLAASEVGLSRQAMGEAPLRIEGRSQ